MDEVIDHFSPHDAAVQRAFGEGNFTDGELLILKWQLRKCSHFASALIEAIAHADERNLDRFRLGFPEEVEAFVRWRNGNLATIWREMGIDL